MAVRDLDVAQRDAPGARAAELADERPLLEPGEDHAPVTGKVLFLAANPGSAPHLAIDEELRAVERKIRMSDGRDSLRVVAGLAVRAEDLLQLLNEHRPAIVHYSGHGTTAGALTLVDARGEARLFPAHALDALAMTMKAHVQVVVLNACYSLAQAQVIGRHIGFVIGMTAAVSDRAAIVFSAAFYGALGFGRGVPESFEQARTALILDGCAEDQTPVLLVRGRRVGPAIPR